MLQLLIVAVMTVHLLAMNIASAGPLFCIWLRGLRNPATELRIELGKSFAWLSLAAFVLGMVTGGILWLVPPSPGLSEATARFPARAYWNAGLELMFTFACLLAYVMCWKKLRTHPILHAIFPILASTNLLYHFPPMMAIFGKLAANPNWTTIAVIDRPAFRRLMVDSEVLSLSAHFSLASIAVTALALFVVYTRQQGKDEQEEGKRIVRVAAVVALVSSALQLPVGIWILSALPSQSRNSLMGGELTASLLLVGGMLMTFVFLQHLAGIALGDVCPKTLRRVGLLMIVLVLLMTATMQAARKAETRSTTGQQTKAAVEASPPRLLGLL